MRGLYVLNTNTNHNAQIFATPGLSGVMIGLGWQDVEPNESGKYDWTLLDAAIAQVPANLKISLDITAGMQAPAWVNSLPGVATVEVTINTKPHGAASNVKLPTPWCAAYVSAYTALMEAVKAHLTETNAVSRISAIRHGLFGGLDSEMEILWANTNGPVAENAKIWAAAGFRPSTVLNVWSEFASTLFSMFPGVIVIQSLMSPSIVFPWVDNNGNVLTKDNSTANVTAMIAAAGDKFGYNIMFLDTSLATCKPSQVIIDAPAAGCLLGFQTNAWGGSQGAMTGSHEDPSPGSTTGLQEIVANGQSFGCNYIELHAADVLNWPLAIPLCAALLA